MGKCGECRELPHAADYNLVHFEEELNRGLYFESSIPQGYGAGSSGALIAAFYEHFSISPITNPSDTHLKELKKELGVLESYFHGNSSGTDPLVSYLKHSLLLAKDKIDKILQGVDGLQLKLKNTFEAKDEVLIPILPVNNNEPVNV